MPLPLLIAAAIPAVAGLIGQALGSGDRAKAEALRAQAMQQYNIELPPVDELAKQADSSLGSYRQDPRIAKARMEALSELGRRSQEGYTVEDRAAVGGMLDEVGQADRSAREAIQQRLSPNSGAGIAAQMQAQQGSYQNAHRRGMDLAANSRRQALQALSQYGGMADQFGRSDFGEAQAKAGAQDSINRFNTQNSVEAPWRRTNAQIQIANGRAGAMTGQAGSYDNRAATTANTALEVGRSAAGAIKGATELSDYEKWKLSQQNPYQRQPDDSTI